MTPARPKVSPKPGKGMTPKKSLATEKAMVKKKDAAAGKKPGMGPGVSPKPASGGLMGGMMGGKAKDFMDKMKRKSSGSAATTPSVPAMKKGGMCGAKKYAKGGGIEVRGKTKGKMI